MKWFNLQVYSVMFLDVIRASIERYVWRMRGKICVTRLDLSTSIPRRRLRYRPTHTTRSVTRFLHLSLSDYFGSVV